MTLLEEVEEYLRTNNVSAYRLEKMGGLYSGFVSHLRKGYTITPEREAKMRHALTLPPPPVKEATGPTRTCGCGNTMSKQSKVCRSCHFKAVNDGRKGNPTPRKPMWYIPEGFAADARNMNAIQLASRYGKAVDTVRRWARECGITLMPVHIRFRRALPRQAVDNRDTTLVGRAAKFLQSYGNIYRCNEKREQDIAGQFWNRGGFLLTDEEVISRAERLGWSPDEWRKVA